MLSLNRVYGENFCQHPSFDHTFGPGFSCLIGPNGSGKSNTIRAIFLALLGEVYGPGNLVMDGRLKGHVGAELGSPRGDFTITRSLKFNNKTGGVMIRHTLEADWLEEKIEKKADIAAFMSTWIGHQNVLEYVNFALQGKFAELITCDHMTRAKLLNALMGHDRAERLRGMLQDAGRRIADLPDRQEAIDQLTRELDELETQEILLTTRRNNAAKQMTPQVKGAYEQALVVRAKQSSALRDADRQTQVNLLVTAEQGLTAVKNKLEAQPDLTEISAPDENGYLMHQTYLKSKEQMEKREAEFKAFPPPPNPEYDDPDALLKTKNEEISDLNFRQSELQREIQAAGDGVCPTCKRPYEDRVDTEPLKAELKEKQEKVAALLAEVQKILRAKSDYEREHASWETTFKNVESSVELHRKNMEAAADFKDFDVDAHMKARESYSQYAANLEARNKLEREKSQAERLVDTIRAEIKRLDSLDVATQEQKTWAANMIKTYEELEATHRNADSELKVCLVNKESTRERQHMLRTDMDKRSTNTACRNLLEFSREQLHAERLPRLAAQSSIESINRAMRRYLAMFSFPYPFYLNENLDFVVDYQASRGIPAEVLSGGELIRAAMAMRFALMEVFKAGIGVLVIDEPTTFLDTDARAALVEVLGQAAGTFKQNQIKIICPTHAPELTGAADDIILIGEQ